MTIAKCKEAGYEALAAHDLEGYCAGHYAMHELARRKKIKKEKTMGRSPKPIPENLKCKKCEKLASAVVDAASGKRAAFNFKQETCASCRSSKRKPASSPVAAPATERVSIGEISCRTCIHKNVCRVLLTFDTALSDVSSALYLASICKEYRVAY